MSSKCIFCGAEPKVIHYDTNMWYVECSNRACQKHGKYEYLGMSEKVALERWEYKNRPIQRTSYKKEQGKTGKRTGKRGVN